MEMIKKFATAGTITAVLSFLAILAGAFGQEGLKTFLSDPATAQNILSAVGAVLALVAGALNGVKKA